MPLREVLDAFEQTGPLSLAQLARQLGAEETALEGMLRFWVNKGRLREVNSQNCDACDVRQGCPLLTAIPHRYELVTGDGSALDESPACHHKR